VCARIVVCNSWLVRAWPEGTHGTDVTHINVESLPHEPSQMKCDISEGFFVPYRPKPWRWTKV
jgi:hypothetical protein